MSSAARRQPSPDVIVVGGGVTGTSIAWRLAESGKRVLLLERRGICSGASGRNGGMTGAGSSLHASSRAGRAVYGLTTANLKLIKTLPDELGRDFELRLSGSMNVITTAEQMTHLEHAVAAEREAGIDVELLDAEAARAVMPALSPDILGVTYTRDRGHLWPFALVNGLADAAAREGADIRAGTTVERLAWTGNRVAGVVADGETILVTQPLPPILACPFGTNFDKEYGRQTPGGQILCGGFRRLDVNEGLGTYREEVTTAVLTGIAGCLTTLFPGLRGKTRVVRAWAGIMGFTADGLPLIGRYDPAPGLTVAAGFNGGGFSWGAIVGQVIARILSGEAPGFDLEPFRPARFLDGDIAWANPFTAGEANNPRHTSALAVPEQAKIVSF